ncbi:MAG: diguanylate cyclase [Bryobacteraceae bacterium]
MMSLLKALRSADLRACHDTLQRVVALLLQGMRLHAVAGEKDSYAIFAEKMNRHESEFELVQSDPDQMLVVLGCILSTFRDYNQQVALDSGNGRRELQRMTIMLTKSLTGLLAGGQRNVDLLQTFEDQVEKTSGLNDLKSMRASLETCLASIQIERTRRTTEQASLREMVHSVVTDPVVTKSFASKGEDTLTGLPDLMLAQSRLLEMIQSGVPGYAVPLRLDSLQIINARYGRQAGDDFVLRATQLLAQYLQPNDVLFRWGGAVFLVLLVRPCTLDVARAEVERITGKIREHTTMLGGSSVMFRICASSTCLPIRRYANIDILTAEVNAFAYGAL